MDDSEFSTEHTGIYKIVLIRRNLFRPLSTGARSRGAFPRTSLRRDGSASLISRAGRKKRAYPPRTLPLDVSSNVYYMPPGRAGQRQPKVKKVASSIGPVLKIVSGKLFLVYRVLRIT